MANAFVEYFRCPDDLAPLEAPSRLSSSPGYFRFGHAICFGRREGGDPARHIGDGLENVLGTVGWNRDGLRLPFDLAEVAFNLRQEQYLHDPRSLGERVTANPAAHAVYYLLRPAMPIPVRKQLQRVGLAGWDGIPFPRWPVETSVDDLMAHVMTSLLRYGSAATIPFIWFWPDGAPSCAVMTHDVETSAGRDYCAELAALDAGFGVKASYQIVPEDRYEVPSTLLDQIRAAGCEVNIHDLNHDGRLFQSRRRFQQRAARINRYAAEYRADGFRAGAMYRRQEWFAALRFSYDMSVPNVAHLEGQRGGCCTVMPYFIDGMLELPLTTIQDYTLFHILNEYSTGRWVEQMDVIKAKHGLVTFIAHPDYLIDPYARDVYRELLQELVSRRDAGQAWIALPGEVNRWWRNRHAMSLVRDGSHWDITGPDRDRARVAYAVIRDDRLAFTFNLP